jgi:hypothetical protein
MALEWATTAVGQNRIKRPSPSKQNKQGAENERISGGIGRQSTVRGGTGVLPLELLSGEAGYTCIDG